MFLGLKDYGVRNRLDTLKCKYAFGFLYTEVYFRIINNFNI